MTFSTRYPAVYLQDGVEIVQSRTFAELNAEMISSGVYCIDLGRCSWMLSDVCTVSPPDSYAHVFAWYLCLFDSPHATGDFGRASDLELEPGVVSRTKHRSLPERVEAEHVATAHQRRHAEQ
jgi:hypothetical protein